MLLPVVPAYLECYFLSSWSVPTMPRPLLLSKSNKHTHYHNRVVCRDLVGDRSICVINSLSVLYWGFTGDNYIPCPINYPKHTHTHCSPDYLQCLCSRWSWYSATNSSAGGRVSLSLTPPELVRPGLNLPDLLLASDPLGPVAPPLILPDPLMLDPHMLTPAHPKVFTLANQDCYR